MSKQIFLENVNIEHASAQAKLNYINSVGKLTFSKAQMLR